MAVAEGGKERKTSEKRPGSPVVDPDDSHSIDDEVYGGGQRRESAGSDDGLEMVRTRYSFEAENEGEVSSAQLHRCTQINPASLAYGCCERGCRCARQKR